MKFINTLLIALLAALGVYAARHRIVLALKVGAVVYLLMLPLRLLSVGGAFFERLDELIWPVAGLLVVWVVLWWISTRYEQRKQAQAGLRKPKTAGGRFRL
jgi:hypothetical protein